MKTNIIAIILFSLISTAYCQTEKGKYMVGGSLSGSSRSENSYYDYKNNYFSISPVGGYFFSNNWVVGLNPVYNRNSSKSTNSIGRYYYEKKNTYLIGPYVRYYKKLGEKAAIYVRFSAGAQIFRDISIRKNPDYLPENFESKYTSSGFYANISAGFVYFITPKVGLELSPGSIAYSFISQRKVNELNYSLGIQYLSLGAFVYL